MDLPPYENKSVKNLLCEGMHIIEVKSQYCDGSLKRGAVGLPVNRQLLYMSIVGEDVSQSFFSYIYLGIRRTYTHTVSSTMFERPDSLWLIKVVLNKLLLIIRS